MLNTIQIVEHGKKIEPMVPERNEDDSATIITEKTPKGTK